MTNKTIQSSDLAKEYIENLAKELNITQKDVLDFLVDTHKKAEALKAKSVEKLMENNESIPAKLKVKMFVDAIMKHNLKAEDKDKIYLGQTFVQRETGCNRNVVTDYLNSIKEVLDKHYQKIKMDVSNEAKLNLQFRDKLFFSKTDGKLDYITEILKKEDIAHVFGR